MQFTLASLALCASSALALQVNTPGAPLTAGQPFTITLVRDGGETGSVTVSLRKGDAANLATIETIGQTTTDSLVFTPSTSLADGSDYAFEAVYGTETGKYSAFFTITGASASTSSTSASSSSSSSTSSVSTLTPTTPVTTLTSYDASSSTTMTTTSTGSPVIVVPSNTTLTTVHPVTNTAGSTIGVGPTVITGNGTLSNTLTSYTTTAAAGGETAMSTSTETGSAAGSGAYGASGNSTTPVQQVGNGAMALVASPLVLMAAAAAVLF